MKDEIKGIDYYESFTKIQIPEKVSPIKPFEELEAITMVVINYLINEKLVNVEDMTTIVSGILSFCIINSDVDIEAVHELVKRSVTKAAGVRSRMHGLSA